MEYYNQIFVLLEDCLVTVKSGSRCPKNIADFMPDYNLWYAIKFAKPKEIVVLENTDLSKSVQSNWFGLKLDFISEWLSEITGIKVKSGYSFHGDWKFLFGYPGDSDLIDYFYEEGKALFIDRDRELYKEYIRGKNLIYMTKTEFSEKYNRSPRKYVKTPLKRP